MGAYIEIDAPRRLLERCLQDFKLDEREFMISVYLIACMEMMTNARARALIAGHQHEATSKSIQYALDRLIERGKIPAVDTRLFAVLWAQSMFSGAVSWLGGISGAPEGSISSLGFHEMGEFMIDAAISGKISPDIA